MPALRIRTKVLLLSVLLLTIPYVGYRYVTQMEDFLRENLEATLLGGAQALAGALHDRSELLASAAHGSTSALDSIQAVALPQPIQVDGYGDDWRLVEANASTLRPRVEGDDSGRYIVGAIDEHLYVIVFVNDPRVVYSDVGGGFTGDHVRILTSGSNSRRRAYRLATPSPGWVAVQEVMPTRDAGRLVGPEPRIRAEWQATTDGFVVEARIPASLIGERLGIELWASDGPGTAARLRASAASPLAPSPELELVKPSAPITALIRSLGRVPGRRIRVVDARGNVIARGGSLEATTDAEPGLPMMALLLPPPRVDAFASEMHLARLDGPEIEAALAGEAAARWRGAHAAGTYIVSAAHPVWSGDRIAGAVVVEESSLGIQTFKREAFSNLFTTTLVVFVVGAIVLVAFASRISIRLIRLRDQTESAIDPHGRVVGSVDTAGSGDEIGDLAASFDALLERLRGYNDYLERLARRLSHELRTPIAVVRSSMENLAHDSAIATTPYLGRAQEGLARLDAIIMRMSEATRIEQALGDFDFERFNLGQVIGEAVEGYRSVWTKEQFLLELPDEPVTINGVPELVVQLLDKLIANAIEFRRPGSPIVLRLLDDGALGRLEVENIGPPLPRGMKDALFDSMVSIREHPGHGEPHLGLGLHIVKLIAELHGGVTHALDRDADRVTIVVGFPLAGPRGN